MAMQRRVEAVQCSIVDAGTEAIVNASNPYAMLGSGVSRAVFDECGGEVLQAEMLEKLEAELDGELGPDDCLVTSGGSSPRIRYVLHVASVSAGPAGVGLTSTAERVASATEAALARASQLGDEHGPITIAFPLLGAGVGGLSPGVALKAMVDGLRSFFRGQPDAPIARLVFAVPDARTFELVQTQLARLLVLPGTT